MKKLLTVLTCTVAISGCVAGLSACNTVNKISSAEDLYGMQKGKNYKLTCDIDLAGQVWSPLPVKNFNGNGHTISNAVVNAGYGDAYSDSSNRAGFFAEAYGISNVIFDNINVTAGFAESADGYICGGIVCGYAYDYGSKSAGLLNVTVKNSSLVITSLAKYGVYIGGICGYNLLETKGCTIENCNITYVAAKSNNEWLHIGGIVGYSGSVSGNDVTDCNFINSSLNCTGLSYVNAGGIVGEMKNGGNIKNCVSAGNEISLDTTGCNNGSRLGGIAGNTDADKCGIENSAAINNLIKAEAKQSYTVGGIVGRNCGAVKNCLSDGNGITASLSVSKDEAAAYAGGFCGSNYGTVSRSVVQNSSVSGTKFGIPYEISVGANKLAAGFTGYSAGSLAYCGTNNNTVSGGLNYLFTPQYDMVFNCLQNADSNQWANAIEILNLDTSLWKYDGGLKLNIGEI